VTVTVLFREETQTANESEIPDPVCDPSNPVKVTYEKILNAAEKISCGVVRTPCTVSKVVTT